MDLSIVLPCFNEEGSIANAVRETIVWMRHARHSGQVIVVDDGSRDRTPDILLRLQREIPELKVVSHEHNRGYGLAVRSGCDAATGDTIAFMDSDGQFHIDDMQTLLPFLLSFAFVAGRRRHRADPFVRKLFGKVLGLLVWLEFGLWIRDVNCGMKAFRRAVWPVIRPAYGTEKFFNTELFLRLRRANIPWKQVDVPHYPRTAGSPTGGSLRVIGRMFREMRELKRGLLSEPQAGSAAGSGRTATPRS